MAQFGVGSSNHMQLPYKATVPDQAESRAALIVAYLILYRLLCHHTEDIVGCHGNGTCICLQEVEHGACLLRTPKYVVWGFLMFELKGVAITTNNPLCLIRWCQRRKPPADPMSHT